MQEQDTMYLSTSQVCNMDNIILASIFFGFIALGFILKKATNKTREKMLKELDELEQFEENKN